VLPKDDTIAAIATPAGSGGVGIVRISGPAARDILGKVVSCAPDSLEPRVLRHGHARQGDAVIDEVLYVFMAGPRSFTGEDTAEIHGHGGAANMARLLGCVLDAGARPAEPGEFTRRAFDNGRLDLTRAEAIADIVNASSDRALRIAQSQLRGELGTSVATLREGAIAGLAEVEAHIDFPEDDLPPEMVAESRARWRDVASRCQALAETFRTGRALVQGVEVALVGGVNAGKSSLFNRLLGSERALVAAEPGTTRDYVEGKVVWDGIEVTLIDTAGARGAESEVEKRGIELGRERARGADLELLVTPAGEETPAATGERQLVVFSKCDLSPGGEGVCTSARTGAGLEELKRAVLERVVGVELEADDSAVVTSERQHERLQRAARGLDAAAAQLGSGPLEVIAIELRHACDALAEISGEGVGEEMLDALFAKFCIGK
jgi:tRNA modification GTPase